MSATTLEKYRSGGRNRYKCPQCGVAKTFARYVDEQGKYFADHVGRCNRESNCGYHFTPKQFWGEKTNLPLTKSHESDTKKGVKTNIVESNIQVIQALPKWVYEETQTAPDCN